MKMFLVTCYSISINLCGREQHTYQRAICASMWSQVLVTRSVARLTCTLVLSTDKMSRPSTLGNLALRKVLTTEVAAKESSMFLIDSQPG